MVKQSGRMGFTLLELMIVIIVINVLATFALPRYLRVLERVRWAEAKSVLPVFRGAQVRYKAQWGAYANSVDALDTDVTPGRYFTFYPSGSSGQWIAVACRNTSQDSLKLNGQYVWINEEGEYWYPPDVPAWLR